MITRISGWGNTPVSFTNLESNVEDFEQLDLRHNRGIIPRGLGSSYGDSASNSGGVTLVTKNLQSLRIDVEKGFAVVGSGVTILELERESLLSGFFPYVVPGTSKVTIGGAIASDIHGKSHHKVGSFSNHLLEIKLLTSDRRVEVLRPVGKSAQKFWATVGGMGLTGLILEATISLRKIESPLVSVHEKRVKNLDALLETLLQLNEEYLYTVAWIDLSGKFEGRGIVSGANHVSFGSESSGPVSNVKTRVNRKSFKVFYPFRTGAINRFSIKIFNWVWYHKPLGKKIQHIQDYLHPLDGLENWNSLYGRSGFIQYQFVIPFDQSAVLKRVLAQLKRDKCHSFLSVLKSFGEDSNGLIGFPMKGWTLAIDFPRNSRNLSNILKNLDQEVLKAGGRIYLTKDSRMNHLHLERMYKHIGDWKDLKKQMDPHNLWQSDQGRRLKLC